MKPALQEAMEELILASPKRRQTILDVLSSTRRRVILSLFRCDDEEVLHSIMAAAKRKVDVKVLMTPRARGWNKRLGDLVKILKEAGVDVCQYSGPWAKYHAKYIVSDDQIALVSSLNLTRKCFDDTFDFILISRRPDLISGLTTLFYFDWHAPDVTLPEIPERLIVGPDRTRFRIIPLLQRATFRIRIVDHRVTDSQVLLTLARKMKDGIHVEILGRGQLGGLVSHGKTILIDNDVAVVGSLSLSEAGLDIRREVAVVIDDRAMVAELNRFFDRAADAHAERMDKSADDDDEDDE
jgi:phosphatidylserine/phosphatidylglycerophosphate/cardiolipin synthase-like enzyme